MSSPLSPALAERSGNRCELCGSTEDLSAHDVPPRGNPVVVCSTCSAQLTGASPLDARHWFCLREAIWNEEPAVQVLSWRLLQRLGAEPWAADLLDQVFLDEEVLAWARAGAEAETEAPVVVVDSLGVPLVNGDSVSLIKDLDVKGVSFVAKRGTVVKGIRLGEDPEHVEGRVNGVAIYLKTCFLKKV